MSRQSGKKGRKLKFTPTMTVTILVAFITAAGTIFSSLIPPAFEYLKTVKVEKLQEQSRSTNTSSPTPAETSIAWTSLVSVKRASDCFGAYLPEYIFEGQEKIAWLEDHFLPHYEKEDLIYAPHSLAGDGGSLATVNYAITNILKGGPWVRIEKKISVSIQYIKDAPSTTDVSTPSTCKPAGNTRTFPGVPLKSDFPQYTDKLIADGTADYYSLEPGEFETFSLRFDCQAPGIYAVTLEVPMNHQGKDSKITYSDTPGILCPHDATYYSWEPVSSKVKVLDVTKYRWANSTYERSAP